MARPDDAYSAEAVMVLFGDTPAAMARRTGIPAERLEEHFSDGCVLSAAEAATIRRVYRSLGVFTWSGPGVEAVVQFTWVMVIRGALRRHERWPEPWSGDTWRDRLLGRLWRWSLRMRGLDHRIGRDLPETVAAYAEIGIGPNGVRLDARHDD